MHTSKVSKVTTRGLGIFAVDDAGEHPTGQPDNKSRTGSIFPGGQQHSTEGIITRYTRTKQWKYSPNLYIAYRT